MRVAVLVTSKKGVQSYLILWSLSSFSIKSHFREAGLATSQTVHTDATSLLQKSPKGDLVKSAGRLSCSLRDFHLGACAERVPLAWRQRVRFFPDFYCSRIRQYPVRKTKTVDLNTRDPLSIKPPGVIAPDFVAGQKLAGCYVLGRRVESGNGAEIWLAYDEVRGRELSLYFIPKAVRVDQPAMGEIRVLVDRLQRLIHPNILRVHTLLEEVQWSAIVMDHFDGETLWAIQQRKAGGCFEPAEISPWLVQICAALDEAHKIGITHGEVSPWNIYIQKSGSPLLANFGVGRSVRARNEQAPAIGEDMQAFGILMHTLLVGSAPAVVIPSVPESRPAELAETSVVGLGAMKIPSEALSSIGYRRAAVRKTGLAAISAGWEKIAAACLEKNAELQPASMAEIAVRLVPEKAAMPNLVLPKGLARQAPSKVEVPAFARPKMPPIGMLLAKPKPPTPVRPEPAFLQPRELPIDPPLIPKPAVPGLSIAPRPEHDVVPVEAPAGVKTPAAAETPAGVEPSESERAAPPRKASRSRAAFGLAAALLLCAAGIYAYCMHEKQKAVERRPVVKTQGKEVPQKIVPKESREVLGAAPMIEPLADSGEKDDATHSAQTDAATPAAEEARVNSVEELRALEIQAANSRYEEKMKALAETMRKFQELSPADAATGSEPLAPDAEAPKPDSAHVIEPPREIEEMKAPPAASEKAPLAPEPVKEFKNSLGMKFLPVGKVLFSIWPTRFSDFEAYATATKFRSKLWKTTDAKQAPDHPVVYVSWLDAMSFCNWLTEKEHQEGTLPANQRYRLPHDLEWSAAIGLAQENGETPAARDMGVPNIYPWGDAWPPTAGAGNYAGEETRMAAAIKGYKDEFPQTSPVGSFLPNSNGLYDMGGNVWQWCMEAWSAGDAKSKVLRGASWSDGRLKPALLSSCRIRSQQDNKAENFGFRCVIETAD
ncbi:MAG: c-type lectin fold [Chthoniobacteraceae bacterium]|nr:c-type lectin fold [Chthoniobacteraceae bacterium]